MSANDEALPPSTGDREAPPDSRDLQVLARATGVLNMFSQDRSVIDLASATREVGLNRSTTYRYLTAMVKHGLLVHTPGQGYTLGPLSVRLGLLSLDRLPLIDRADPVMRELSETVHETSTLSVWGGSGPLVARVHDKQSQFIRISIAVGSTRTSPTSAASRGRPAGSPRPNAPPCSTAGPRSGAAASPSATRRPTACGA
jgi:DNA-binding IclR family transcriptional regulator